MKKGFRRIGFFCAWVLLSGCMVAPMPMKINPRWPGTPVASQVPVPNGYRLSTQPKMQSIHHWDVLAKDVAQKVESQLSDTFLKDQYTLYVAPSGTTAFEKVFHQLLITRLTENGMTMSSKPEDALVLSFDIEMVRHAARLVRTKEGVFKSLAPGFMVKDDTPLSGPFSQVQAAEIQVGNAQLNMEAGLYTMTLPEIEVVVTTSLTRDNIYVARTSSVYYINDLEWWHYKNRTGIHSPSLVTFSIVDE